MAGGTLPIVALPFLALPTTALAQHVYAPHLHPVAVIAPTRLRLDTPQGAAQFPLYLSADWNVPQPRIERAVIVIHGKLRNADVYYRTALHARDAAGADPATTLMIAPQFLATLDMSAHDLPADMLHWNENGWMGGEPAEGSVPISSYAVLDAIVARLADRHLFPRLKQIVFAGHSGGAQVVQRYAVASHGLRTLAQEGIDVSYLVSSPSSYVYFDDTRPSANGGFAPFDAAQCASFDDWKYGMRKRPPYVNDRGPEQLEAAYASRRVTYLVGGNDDAPNQAALDRSCPAEAQGPQRVARAESYFHYLQARHPEGFNQHFHVVPGVGHNGARMLTSSCALATMFGTGSCQQ
ncbi:alpha/beta hydrolase [Trinickia dinghuensis]|uniref:Alpha/beta hydrolase n=1 Tax=Trinickia dinghuensis TaxID=2291023 RepID=A0A3D8JT54_9BURK|nr:alpha/beta hydrolase [Trinickia dinghuensis]RDU95591.1 alpha/beta hydrolase [Trinickia dinghuensis]